MRNVIKVLAIISILPILLIGFAISIFNSLQTLDEDTIAAWSNVSNLYERRAALVPNLVNTVKGYAAHEEKLLTELTEARAKIGSIKIEGSPTAEQLKSLEQANAQLGGALSRLLAVSENYPELKSAPLFQDLMTQLEGSENRIAVARSAYIEKIRDYNASIRKFPNSLIAKPLGLKRKANFESSNPNVSETPKVEF